MEVLAIAVQKGGTGKTTTAVVIAQAAHYSGKKTLLIDLDPQGNATMASGARPGTGSTFDLFQGTPAAECIRKTDTGVDIIPASRNLATLETGRGSARRLQAAIAPLRAEYDLIVIDTPTGGELLYNALQAATGVIIPIQADTYNLQSLYLTAATVKTIQASNPDLSFKGIIFTQYDQRSNIVKKMAEIIKAKAEELNIPYLGNVRNAAVIKEAAAYTQSLYLYAPKSKPAADYMEILNKII